MRPETYHDSGYRRPGHLWDPASAAFDISGYLQ